MRLLLTVVVMGGDYFVMWWLRGFPPPTLIVVQLLLFGFCFGLACDVSEECLKRAARFGVRVHRDPNMTRIRQLWGEWRKARRRPDR